MEYLLRGSRTGRDNGRSPSWNGNERQVHYQGRSRTGRRPDNHEQGNLRPPVGSRSTRTGSYMWPAHGGQPSGGHRRRGSPPGRGGLRRVMRTVLSHLEYSPPSLKSSWRMALQISPSASTLLGMTTSV